MKIILNIDPGGAKFEWQLKRGSQKGRGIKAWRSQSTQKVLEFIFGSSKSLISQRKDSDIGGLCWSVGAMS